MKLSRRRKSARRGRHTKRTGKHLRYKVKKVHGSKRYHRGHKRTHKRGRRLQGGWVPVPCTGDYDKGFEKIVDNEKEVKYSNSRSNKTVTLTYKKQVGYPSTEANDEFGITIEFGFKFEFSGSLKPYVKESLTIFFIRHPLDEKSPCFYFSGPKAEILDKIVEPTTWSNIKESEMERAIGSKKYGDKEYRDTSTIVFREKHIAEPRTYNFGSNMAIFSIIRACIEAAMNHHIPSVTPLPPVSSPY